MCRVSRQLLEGTEVDPILFLWIQISCAGQLAGHSLSHCKMLVRHMCVYVVATSRKDVIAMIIVVSRGRRSAAQPYII